MMESRGIFLAANGRIADSYTRRNGVSHGWRWNLHKKDNVLGSDQDG